MAKIVGRALIFWDPDDPTRKRDAIDTDQITPSVDCVSESLERLDERWKAGAFRHLMPGFRARVHGGATFLVAGDRFAIGSSREMSPAGLKGVAEEVGLDLVVVCGRDMGDIFRRNALNLGLHVVQSPEAVADAQDGDLFELDPETRALRNLTQERDYTPLPFTEKEEELRRDGGIFEVGRRAFAERPSLERRIEFPDPSLARRLTTTEQILWAHRVDRDAEVRPGTTLRVWTDLLPASDGTGPFAIHTFRKITEGRSSGPRRAAIVNDHFVFTGQDADDAQTEISRQFARRWKVGAPHYAAPGSGIFHIYLPEQGLVLPGALIPGADSHSRAYGGYGALSIGVGSTTVGLGWSVGWIYFTLAEARRVVLQGRLQPWVSGKDIVLRLLRRWGGRLSGGMSVEFVDADLQIPIAYRSTIANMMAEGEAQNGIFAQDAITTAWFEKRGFKLTYPTLQPGADARWVLDETLQLDEVAPMVAKPFAPGNAYPAEDVARERITFDRAMLGSCTNGSYADLLQAALVIQAAGERGVDRIPEGRDLVVFPGSARIRAQIEQPEPRLGGASIAATFRGIGGAVRRSWCGPCFGQGPDALRPGQRAITTFNRNWQNRMGVGGEGYLASPAVVAASALCGYIAPPSELGLRWDPDRFGV